MNKYEKIFSIINIDEIEKYVETYKKSIHLSISNKEVELTNKETYLDEKQEEIERILNSSNTNLEKSSEISKELFETFENTQKFISELHRVSLSEFTDIQIVIEENIKNEYPKVYNKIQKNIVEIVKKYDNEKRALLDKLN